MEKCTQLLTVLQRFCSLNCQDRWTEDHWWQIWLFLYISLSSWTQYLFRRTNKVHIVNTVPFMNWVVIENTFVIIGASIPLIRPLFTRSKDRSLTAYTANAIYEMNSRSQSGTKGPFSVPEHKPAAFQSSSEENILPIHSGPGQASDIESNNSSGGGQDSGTGIKKEITVEVKYGEDDGTKTPASTWGTNWE